MDYDYTNVPAGFQDLIPGNNAKVEEQPKAQDISQVNNVNLADAGLEFDAEEKAEMSANVAFAEEMSAKLQPENLMMESNTFRKYLANNEDNLKIAKSINAEIPRIPVDVMLKSKENMDKAMEIYQRKKRIQELLPEDEKDYTLDRLFEEYPDILKLDSDVDGAIAFHNIQNVKAMKSITEAGTQGYAAWKLDKEKNDIAMKFYDGKKLTENDFERVKKIKEQQKEMIMNAPDFLADPLKAIAYGTMQNAPMMFTQGGRAQLYAIPAAAMAGMITAGVTKNPTATMTTARGVYSTVSKIGYGVEMFKDTVGNYCLDYLEYKDKDGKQLLTDEEVRVAATLAAAGEAYLEVANWNNVMDMLKGTPGGEEAKEVLSGIIANAADKTSAKTQIAYYLKNRFGKALGVFADEIKEEGQQSIWTDTVHNLFAMYKPGGTLQPISAGEMVKNAFDNMWEAVPAVVGMTAGGNIVSGTRIMRKMASALQEQSSYATAVQNNVVGQTMIEQLIENKQDNKLAKESPEIYNKLLTNQLEGTRYEKVEIDAELLAKDQEGADIFYQMAEAAGKTREEADKILNDGRKLSVPMAKYVEAVEDNNIREKLKNYISFDASENCFARNKQVAENTKRQLEGVLAKDLEKYMEGVKNFVDSTFQDEQERAVANQILMEYVNPEEGVKAVREEYQKKIDNLLEPVLETMRAGMKNGVAFMSKDINGNYDINEEGHIEGHGRVSNNDLWYSNYYKENKKAPSEKEMRELARNALLGDNPYEIMTENMFASGKEAAETLKYYEDEFNNIDNVLATLDKIEPTMKNLDASELVSMEGLSKEGVEVFKTVREYLNNAPGAKSKTAAVAGAVMVAHHAEAYAEMRRKMGDTNYTAKDWADSVGFKYGESMNGNVLNQQNDKGHIGHENTIQRSAKELLADFNEFEAQEYEEIPVLKIETTSLQDERTKWLNVFRETYPKVGDHIELKNKYGTKVRVKTAFCKEVMRHAFNKDTLQLIPRLQEILDRSVFLFANNVEPESTTEIDKHTVRYEVYGTKVKINGTEYCCKTVLRLDTKGNYYLYDMDIEKEIKKEDTSNASTPVTTTGRALKDISLIENSIPWWRKEVNEKLLKDSSNDVLKQEGTNTVVQEQMNAVKEQYYGTKQWMKAPDGTNTKFTEEQWLYAHTEAFKEKYGDWEYAAQQKILKKQEPIEINPNGIVQGEGESKIKSAVNAFTELYPKGANVYSVIGDIRIDANSIKDSLSHKFSLEKYQACLSLVKGMNQAAYMGQMPDLDGNKDVTNEFFAFKVTFNGKNLYAICRTRSAFGNHRLYLHEVGSEETIKKWSKPISWPPGDNQVQLRGIALYSSILAQFTQENNTLNCSLTENGEPDFSKINDDSNIFMQTKADITDNPSFRQWFSESKTVDENGQPLVFYHGTATPNITEFKHSKAQDKAGREMAMGQGKGKFYFATTEMAANAAAQGAMWRGQGKNPTVMPVYLKLENPVDLQTYKDRYQELSGHDLNEGYSDGYTMKDRDKFIAKLDKQLQKEGIDGIFDKGYGFAAVFNANQIKSTENQGTFDSANNNIYMQQGEEKDLVAYHNISQENLIKALNAGGLPVPSLAITQKNIDFDSFGEITLVGTADIIDPQKGTDVYSRDAYTTRVPKPEYKAATTKAVKSWEKQHLEKIKKLGADETEIRRIISEAYNYPEETRRELERSPELQAYFLSEVKGKKLELPKEKPEYQNKFMKDANIAAEIEELFKKDISQEELAEALVKPVEKVMAKDVAKLQSEIADFEKRAEKFENQHRPAMAEKCRKRVEQYKSSLNLMNRLHEEYFEVGADGKRRVVSSEVRSMKRAIDIVANVKENAPIDWRFVRSYLYDNYRAEMEEYDSFVEKMMQELMGEPRIKIGNKYYPYTLDNIVKAMIKEHGAGKENFALTTSKLAGIGATQFKSIEDIKRDKGQLRSEQEIKALVEQLDANMEAIVNDIAAAHGYSSWGFGEELNEALAKVIKGGTKATEAKVKKSLSNFDIEVTPEELKRITQAANDYREASTWYFEAKPQRAVGINEFAGAVVPDTINPELLKQLQDMGLQVEQYGLGRSRQEATKAIQDNSDVLFQKQSNVQGYAEINAKGQRIVNLLQAADQSTFMHEMAHIFYDDLKQLAQDPRATEQMARDWNTLYDWASWNADQIKEYEGTASYKEFAKRNAEILEAQEKGYVIRNGRQVSLDKLLEEWAQERFARGFEVYLQEGKAPSKPLQRAFAKFKQWLMKIYKACTGAGAKPSKEVKAVMDRMVATQEEIDNAMTIANIEGMEKQGLFRYLSESSQEMWERNLENIREDVSKKVMKLAMRDMTDKAKEEREEALKKEREAAYERISQEPIFVAWKFLQQNPNLSTSDVVEQFANMTVKEYTEQLRALGGSLDGAVDQYMEMYERNLPQVTNNEIRAAAKEAVTNSYYTKLAEAFELQALEQYVRDEQRLSKKLAKIQAKDEAERKEAEAAIRQLDYRQRQQEERDRSIRALRAETKENERLQERMSKLELQILDLRKQKADIRRESKNNREARIQEVKEQKQKVIDEKIQKLEEQKKLVNEERKRFRLFEQTEGKGKRIYRDALDNYVQNIEKYAEQKMAALPISEATNPAMWARMAENYTNTSLELFARGEYELAARQKRIAFFYRQMAELAEKNRKKVDKRTTALMAHSRTMLKNKNVAANDRYLYNHLMYNFGLANKDALIPPGYPASYTDVLIAYDANLELSYVDQDGNIDLPDWLTGVMGAEAGPYKNGEGYTSLRMDQMELLYNVMNNIYKAGSEAKKLKTTRDAHGNVMHVADVVGEIVGNAMGNIPFQANEDITGAGNETTWEVWKRRANEAHVALLKPETILRQLGDSAIKYIYNPIKLAADNEMMETEILAGKIRGMTEAYRDGIALMYKNQGHENYEQMADKAMADLRTKKNYKLGTSLLTKENVLVLAFNWGTFVNRKRVMDGYNVTQAQVENVLAELDSADWQLVINVWDLFDDYWPRLQEVEANISGVVLEKQEAVPFTIVDKTGFTYNLGGGYYPIKYDRVKNIRIGDHAQDETARLSMSGMTRFGIGLGNTKERMETVPYKLRNDFGVIQEALTDTLHNICMRETVRDVNRIIRDPDFSQFMGEYYGNATVKMLENWILDCWAKEPQQKDFMEKAAQWIRQKQTVAALGFRTTTALLNVCNLPYVIDYLGAGRTMSALKNFYAHPQVQFDMCMEKSIFLRERAETMDRDMGDVLKRNKANPGDKIMNAVEEKAFWFISRTDLMLACPMWISEYERVFQESMDKKMNPEQADREAVLAGDAAVRRTFGSGQIQDLAAVQKGSEFTKTFTMYYSFFSVVHNALMMKVFEARQASFKKEELAKRLQPIAEGVLFWIIIPSAMEACIRAAASGDDKDKEARNVAKKFLATTAGTMVGGIPLLRDTIPAYLEWAMGGRYFGVSGTPIGDTADQVQRIMSGIKSGKKTKLDVLRDVAAVTSSVSGLPKTMLDGMITAMQFIDHGKMTADDIIHYLWAIAFDKNPDKKK